MKPAAKAALVVLGIAVAAAPFWVALMIPFENFEVPPSALDRKAAPTPKPPRRAEILLDLAHWDAATSGARRAAAEDVARRLTDFALLRLETFACGGQTHEVAIFRHATTEMEFVLVPAGTFVMGASASVSDATYDEPQHAARVEGPFLIARVACTAEAYASHADRSELPSPDLRTAVPVLTSWSAAKAFCDAAGLALPTETQWEFACRAGTTSRWSFGQDVRLLADFAWYAANSSRDSNPVASKQPNAFGLYDMHGNVWQWCDGSESAESGRSPVLRGGSSREPAERTGSADRFWFTYGEHPVRDIAGFRPAKTVPLD